MEYERILLGVVALPDYMNCSLLEYAQRIRLAIEGELEKTNPDNFLIALLCDAARCGWELSKKI